MLDAPFTIAEQHYVKIIHSEVIPSMEVVMRSDDGPRDEKTCQ